MNVEVETRRVYSRDLLTTSFVTSRAFILGHAPAAEARQVEGASAQEIIYEMVTISFARKLLRHFSSKYKFHKWLELSFSQILC